MLFTFYLSPSAFHLYFICCVASTGFFFLFLLLFSNKTIDKDGSEAKPYGYADVSGAPLFFLLPFSFGHEGFKIVVHLLHALSPCHAVVVFKCPVPDAVEAAGNAIEIGPGRPGAGINTAAEGAEAVGIDLGHGQAGQQAKEGSGDDARHGGFGFMKTGCVTCWIQAYVRLS